MSPDQTETVVTLPQFFFRGFAIQRVHFEHLPLESKPEGDKKPERIEQKMTLNASARVDADQQIADVTIGLSLRPDPKWMPYLIEVEATGRFGASGATAQQFDTFYKVNAPSILFPYIRDVVHRITQDGKYGTVRLDPMNLMGLIKPEQWENATPAAVQTLD